MKKKYMSPETTSLRFAGYLLDDQYEFMGKNSNTNGSDIEAKEGNMDADQFEDFSSDYSPYRPWTD